jgi:hypothetical protein
LIKVLRSGLCAWPEGLSHALDDRDAVSALIAIMGRGGAILEHSAVLYGQTSVVPWSRELRLGVFRAPPAGGALRGSRVVCMVG